MYNTEFNKNLMKKIGFPADAQACFTKLFAAIDANGEWTADMEQAIQKYMFPMAEDNEEALRRMNALAEKMQMPKYTLHMAFLICCAEILHDRYLEKGYGEKLFYDHMADLRCKLMECRSCKGCWGTFVGGWYHGQYALERFQFDRFQFERSELSEKYDGTVLSNGRVLHTGDKYLNFHIPSMGLPLTDEIRFSSYAKAEEFFKDDFGGGPVLFGCSSWLLYGKYLDFLPEKSNIRKFIQDFELIGQWENKNFGDAWRVFDRFADLPAEQWPRDTSLRRCFAEYVEAGNKTGGGFGVIQFDKGKIIR